MRKMRTFRPMRFWARAVSVLLIAVLLSEDLLGSAGAVLAAVRQEEIQVTEETPAEGGVEPGEDVPAQEETGPADDTLAEEEPQILFELEEERRQNGKQYRLSDGTIMAAEYVMDIHYQDEAGEWENIDNRFLYEAGDAEDAMEGFATAEGAVEFKFAPDAAGGEVVRATGGGYSVGFEILADAAGTVNGEPVREGTKTQTEVLAADMAEMETASAGEAAPGEEPELEVAASPITFIRGEVLNAEEAAVPAAAPERAARMAGTENSEEADALPEVVWAGDWMEDPDEERTSLAEQAALEQVVTSVGYGNVFPGTSLQYITYGSSLKEYILVNERQDAYQYTFRMSLENLIPQMQEDGSILLNDAEEGTAVYEIPSAYMTDAEGAYSDAVEMEILTGQDGTYFLMVTADAQWINAEERAFPVQIDPTLNKNLSVNNSDIRGSYVCSRKPTTTNINYGNMHVGYDGAEDGMLITYLQMRNLPTLPKDSVICGSSLNMAFIGYSHVGLPKINVRAKEVTGTSWSDRFTWNGKPAVSAPVLDHRALSEDKAGTYIGWNITDLVKRHYLTRSGSGDIIALALEAYGYENMKWSSCAKAVLRLTETNAVPVLQIFYRDTKGIEDYYTYQVQDIGNAGAAYVGDYTSQLTVAKAGASYDSTVLPYELGLVYNSTYENFYFSQDAGNNSGIHTKDFSSMRLGTGWKLTAQETVTEVSVTDQSSSTTYLVYNDSDGTEHYFRKSASDSTKYEDEDGLNLTITKSGNNYTMTDKKDNVKTFKNGYLTNIRDANGNQIHIVYNNGTYSSNNINTGGSNRITSVVSQPKDGAPEVIFTLTYDGNSCLTEIADAYGRRYQYRYVMGTATRYHLTEAGRYDSTAGTYAADAKYSYDTSHHRMTLAYDAQRGTGVQYTYGKSTTGYRISGFHEYAASDKSAAQTVGARVRSTSDDLRKTSYTDAGRDRTFDTADDIITTSFFNSAGMTVNAQSVDKEGNLLGVTAAAYEKNSGTSRKNNRMTGSISSGQAGVNLLANGGFERYSGTQAEGWIHGTGGSVACREESTDRGPSYSGRMHYNLYNAGTTGSASISQNVTLKAGETYTFSAYVNTLVVGEFTEGGGAYLRVTSSGKDIAESTVLSYRTDAGVNEGWQRLSTTFTMGQTAAASLMLCWENAYGTLMADDLQLEKGEAATRFNHVYNGSFEEGNTAKGWSLGSGASVSASEKKHGAASVSMTGSPGTSVYAEQTIQIGRSSDTTFLLSGWSKGTSIPDLETGIAGKTDTALRYWGMTLTLNYTDGTKDHYDLPFSEYVRDWQYAAMAVVPKSAGRTISTAVLRLHYQNNANTAWFDGISLTEEPAQTYKYDDKGNLVSVKSSGNGEEGYTYDAATQNLLKAGTEGSGDYTYKYENAANRHLPTSITNDTVTMGLEYDGKGQTTKTTLTNSTDERKMTSTAVYDNGLLTSVTDNTGATSSYIYDERRRVMGAQDPGGQSIYTFYEDAWDRPYIVFQEGKVSVDYSYVKGNLSQIRRGGYVTQGGAKKYQSYDFACDGFGNRTRVSVGEHVLAEYGYSSGNGTLDHMNYGEGGSLASVQYSYDRLDRMTKATYHDSNSGESREYGYRYSSDGDLSAVTEDGETAYTYEYDTLGRLIHSSRLEEGRTVLYTEHKYDTSDRILSQDWQIGEDGFTESYTYSEKDGTLTSMNAGWDTLGFAYDSLKRLDKRTSPVLDTEYSYRDIDETATTTQIAAIRYLRAGTDTEAFPAHTYTYDARGNITEVRIGEEVTGYTYDAQNQLVEEETGNGKTIYTYDTYGNIRSIRKEAGDGSLTGTYAFSYPEEEILDLLTGVTYTDRNGQTVSGEITYDGIGNPLTYFNGDRNWSFTWKYGRQLASATDGTKSISYAYDVDGIRKSKTVDGVEHEYVTLDGMVVRETYGTVTIDYIYDNEGRPYKIVVDENGAVYTGYYVLNQQGDVIALLDTSGNVAVEYDYNAWGNPEAPICTGAAGSRLSQYNALRYRGYYYDAETGLYYLNSRYYDPAIGRFVNADDIDVLSVEQENLLQYNLYTYCFNNPVNIIDSEGMFGVTLGAIVGGAVAGALISTVSYAVGCALNGEEMNTKGLATAAVTGAVCGGVGGALGLASKVTKLFGSAFVGIYAGITTGISSGNGWDGLIAGISAGVACFSGASIDLDGLGPIGMAFGTYCTTLLVSTPAEVVSVAAQKVVSNNSGRTKSAGRTQSRSTQKRTNSYAYRPLGRWTIMSDLYGEDWKAHYQY